MAQDSREYDLRGLYQMLAGAGVNQKAVVRYGGSPNNNESLSMFRAKFRALCPVIPPWKCW